MPDFRDQIASIRAALEAADNDLLRALDARARAVRDYIALRERDPEGYHALPTGPEVLARLREQRKDFPAEGLAEVMREVLGACAEMIAPVRVAVLAPEGGLAHLAARRHFGARAIFEPRATVAEVFDAMARGHVAYGVVPFETSTDGAVSATLYALAEGSARVTAELSLQNTFQLYSRTGNAADAEKIYGSGAAIAQCERSLRAHFPRATVLDVRSGVTAAQLSLEDHGAAALGTQLLPEIAPELRLARADLEDEASSDTRFFVLGKDAPRRTGSDRTIVALALNEEPGSLYSALQPFAERGINLTRLESRTGRGTTWKDLFFVELDGHMSDRAVLTAVDEVKARSKHVKVLGSYPRPQS